jgi:hypothetical protein
MQQRPCDGRDHGCLSDRLLLPLHRRHRIAGRAAEAA